MGLRTIRLIGDDILRKKSKPVDNFDHRLLKLINDMFETMYRADGVGLAAVQVGILKRLFIVDTGEKPMHFINPEIIDKGGNQLDQEGCLSVPGKLGDVERPKWIKIKAFNSDGDEFEYYAEDFEARAILHENDHLNGILYVDLVVQGGK
ncbi:MAG: peptide deformylase [Oscillospiraceae bacterium]|nr:peptide deformylase [Oscillospiraceae bacterium]